MTLQDKIGKALLDMVKMSIKMTSGLESKTNVE